MKFLIDIITHSYWRVWHVLLITIATISIVSCSQAKSKKSSNLETKPTAKNIQLDSSMGSTKASLSKKAPASKQPSKTEISLTKEQYAFGEGLEQKYKDQIAELDGKKIFRNYCTNCHGIKGNLQLNGAKDLTVIESTVARNISQVYFGKGLMTPFQKVLDEKEIVAVASYVQSLRD